MGSPGTAPSCAALPTHARSGEGWGRAGSRAPEPSLKPPLSPPRWLRARGMQQSRAESSGQWCAEEIGFPALIPADIQDIKKGFYASCAQAVYSSLVILFFFFFKQGLHCFLNFEWPPALLDRKSCSLEASCNFNDIKSCDKSVYLIRVWVDLRHDKILNCTFS